MNPIGSEMRRFTFRTLLGLVTLVCLSTGSIRAWQQYQTDQHVRGFIDGVNEMVEHGSHGKIDCAVCFSTSDRYVRGYLEGEAFLRRSTAHLLRRQRVAMVKEALRETCTLSRHLALRTLQEIDH